jgi:hypothetical protein
MNCKSSTPLIPEEPLWRVATPWNNENAPRSDEFIRHVTNKFVTTWLLSEELSMSQRSRNERLAEKMKINHEEPKETKKGPKRSSFPSVLRG